MGTPLHHGWAVLQIGGIQVERDLRQLLVISSAAKLTCVADDRPWQWRNLGDWAEVHIGPPPSPRGSSAA